MSFSGSAGSCGALLAKDHATVGTVLKHALNAAAQHRLGVPAMAMLFSLGDAGALQTLFELAGFAEVAITPRMLVVVFPSRAQYVRRNIESLSAVVPELGAMDGAERTALARTIDEDAGAVLGAHAWGDGIAIPMSAHLIRGVKPATAEF